MISQLLLVGCHSAPSVAFFYGSSMPVSELARYTQVVVEPEHTTDLELRALRAAGSEVYAYVSIGEGDPSRSWYGELDPAWFLGKNPSWGTSILDQTRPEWRAYLLDRRLAPLHRRGFSGLFLDTLESYRVVVQDPARQAAQAAAVADTIELVARRYPGLRLLLNRGFELLPRVAGLCSGVVAESLYQTFDPATKRYFAVPEPQSHALLQRLNEARDRHGLPVVVIDYVAAEDRALARGTARRIAGLGFMPWVTTWTLTALGVGLPDLSGP